MHKKTLTQFVEHQLNYKSISRYITNELKLSAVVIDLCIHKNACNIFATSATGYNCYDTNVISHKHKITSIFIGKTLQVFITCIQALNDIAKIPHVQPKNFHARIHHSNIALDICSEREKLSTALLISGSVMCLFVQPL